VENRQHIAAYAKQYRQENTAYIANLNREWMRKNAAHQAASKKAYQQANLDKYAEINAQRLAAKMRAIPLWADRSAIKRLYAKAVRITQKTGTAHHVDHIVPLQSKRVCGLHCEANLRVLSAFDNQSKSNRLWPDDIGEG
jgi:hypothetical protein